MVNCHRLPQICVISGVNVIVSHGSLQGWGNHGSWGDELRLLPDVRESLEGNELRQGGWLCRFSHPKKNAQKPCIFIPFHPQRRWYTMMKMWCFVAKVHQSLFVEGNRRTHGFSNAMFEILIKNEICEKGYAQFHPKFWPFDTTSRNLPNYLVRWCSMIFSVPCAFSMGVFPACSRDIPIIPPLYHIIPPFCCLTLDSIRFHEHVHSMKSSVFLVKIPWKPHCSSFFLVKSGKIKLFVGRTLMKSMKSPCFMVNPSTFEPWHQPSQASYVPLGAPWSCAWRSWRRCCALTTPRRRWRGRP